MASAQQRLTDLGYWLGPVDGIAGSNTAHAITAFQKANGLSRTGRLNNATRQKLASAHRPDARTTSGNAVEVDLKRQILLMVQDGRTAWVFDISTGKAATNTPPGTYRIERQIDGLRISPLGRLWRPKYFYRGIALHGYPSVPPRPASHGCVRLTYPAMDFVWSAGLAPVGTRVMVY